MPKKNRHSSFNVRIAVIALMLEEIIFIKLNVAIPCRFGGNGRNNVLFMQSYEVSTPRARRQYTDIQGGQLNMAVSF